MILLLPRLRRIGPTLAVVSVLALAGFLRLWALGRPDSLVFDELYYVRDAVSQLAHGYPTIWPDDDPAFGGERARAFGDAASSIAHPPLGKWLIGLGMLMLGADGAGIDSGWGWRIGTAFAGVATVGITMRLGWLMTRSVWFACLAGFLLAVDGVHVVLSRVALLDGLLCCAIALGALFVWRDLAAAAAAAAAGGHPPRWHRPWLLAAALAFGAAAAIKWSGLYPLAAFLLLITVHDLWLRLGRQPRPWFGALAQATATAAIALPAALAAYLASWLGWILNPGGQNRVDGEPWWVSLWRWHADALAWHATLSAEHPFQAHPFGWPLALRPTAMYSVAMSDGSEALISPIPNALVTWGGALALLLLLWGAVRTLRPGTVRSVRTAPVETRTSAARLGPAFWAAAFVLTGYLSGWLPWLLTTGRSAVFQFYAVVLTPFAALALALALGALAALPAPALSQRDPGAVLTNSGLPLSRDPGTVLGRRIAVAIFLGAALVLAVLFWPLWSGMPVAEWFMRAHFWLPAWR